MDNIKTFLESSTIHGVNHISTAGKYGRLLWVLIVFTGFTGAGIMIYESFQAWEESPVTTTVETMPITEITFPKVTVCPPKNTLTDLNYDLIMTKNMTLDNDTRNELTDYAGELLMDYLFESNMLKVSRMQDQDRYYNWYHGYTEIKLPNNDYNGVSYRLTTAAKSGTISTQYFGDRFDADKVDTNIGEYSIYIYPPDNAVYNTTNNLTLHFDIDKVSLKDLTSGTEELYLSDAYDVDINEETTHFGKSYSPPGYRYIRFKRKVSAQEVLKQKLSTMPGFKFQWYYSGMTVESDSQYFANSITKAFVRINFTIFQNVKDKIKALIIY